MHFLIVIGVLLFLTPVSAYAACTDPAGDEGDQIYNTIYKTMQFCDGTNWVAMRGGFIDDGIPPLLQGVDNPNPCTIAKDGLLKYNPSDNPPWQYCDGGTTSWLPFRLPQCQDDDTVACALSATRLDNDPQFKPASIRCGDNILGVIGTYGNGSSNAFTFTDVTNAPLSTLTTAAPAATISGIPVGCPAEVTVTGDGSPQVSINGGGWGSGGVIANGNSLGVRLTSSASFSTTNTATISIGSTDSVWTVTTLAPDTTPDAFSFTDQTGVALSTLTPSNTITINGINTNTSVSVSGDGSPQISINGGAWATSGTITNGQSLEVRLTSSASFATALTATVDVGGVTDIWSVTTRAANGCANQTINWSPACSAASGVMTHGGSTTITNTAGGYSGTRNLSCSDGTITGSGGSCTAALTWVKTLSNCYQGALCGPACSAPSICGGGVGPGVPCGSNGAVCSKFVGGSPSAGFCGSDYYDRYRCQ